MKEMKMKEMKKRTEKIDYLATIELPKKGGVLERERIVLARRRLSSVYTVQRWPGGPIRRVFLVDTDGYDGTTLCHIIVTKKFSHRTRWEERNKMEIAFRKGVAEISKELYALWCDHQPSKEEIEVILERYRKEVERI